MTKAFRGYSQFGAELNAIRTRNVGVGDQLINAHLGHLHRLYGGSTRSTQRSIMQEWLVGSNPQISKKYGPQLADVDQMFLDLKEYAPGLIFAKDIDEVVERSDDFVNAMNRWIDPDYKIQSDIVRSTIDKSKHEFLTPDWWRDYYKTVYPMQTRKSFRTPSALELTWQMRVGAEKAIARAGLIKNIESTWGKAMPAEPDAAWKVLTSGPEHKKWKPITGFDQEIYFPPELHEDLVSMMKMVDNRSTTEIASGPFSRIGTFWKAAVTVYNIPEYFIRDGLSEAWMMFYAGFNPKYSGVGVNVLADSSVYVKALRENPEFVRAFHLADSNNKEALSKAMSLAERATAQQGTRTAVSFGRGFVDDTGNRVNSLSSIEMLKHHTELGL